MVAGKLFVVLALCALLVVVTAQDACTAKTKGYPRGYPVKLQRQYLPPPQQDWMVKFPGNEACPPGMKVVAVTVKACDSLIPPDVTIVDFQRAYIHRYPPVTTTATVDTTVYCNYARNQGQDGDDAVTHPLIN